MAVKLPRQIADTFTLADGEEVVRWMNTRILDMDINRSNPDAANVFLGGSSRDLKTWVFPGSLVITSRRLLFIEQPMGWWGPKDEYVLRDVIDLEAVRGTSVYRKLTGGLRLSVTYATSDSMHERGFQGTDTNLLNDVKSQVDDLVRKRIRAVEEEKKQTRVQFVMDFSFLRSQLDRGGLSLTAVKCPSCAANVNVPETGAFLKCGHCGSTIHALDVFERFKGLLGGL